MLAKTVKMNAKILMAFVLCVSFLVAAAFDERADAEQSVQESYVKTQISVPFAE